MGIAMAFSIYVFEMPDGTTIIYDRDNKKQTEKEWLASKGYPDIDDETIKKSRVYAPYSFSKD